MMPTKKMNILYRQLHLSIVLFFVSLAAHAQFTLVANHPEARAYYPTNDDGVGSPRGRYINVLRNFQNRVYIGFGGDNAETIFGGYLPLAIRYLDENDQLSVPQGALLSQEMDQMEVFQGSLWIPAEDYEGDEYRKCDFLFCQQGLFRLPERASHVYQVAEYNGSIYMVGSIGFFPNCDGAVWKSSNGGNSWSISLRLPVVDINPELSCGRIGLIGVTDNRLFIQPYQFENIIIDGEIGAAFEFELLPDVYQLDQNEWSKLSSNITLQEIGFGGRSVSYLGKMVFIDRGYAGGGRLVAFDGSTKTIITSGVISYTVFGGQLYVLLNDWSVRRTDDLSRFEFLVSGAPSNSISMEIANGAVYVGTTNGQIFKSLLPVPSPVKFIRYKNYLIPIPAES